MLSWSLRHRGKCPCRSIAACATATPAAAIPQVSAKPCRSTASPPYSLNSCVCSFLSLVAQLLARCPCRSTACAPVFSELVQREFRYMDLEGGFWCCCATGGAGAADAAGAASAFDAWWRFWWCWPELVHRLFRSMDWCCWGVGGWS